MISEALAMAQAPGTAPAGGQGITQLIFPLAVFFGIFYFLILRPQKKRDLAHKKFLADLKRGDEVLTQSGLYGRIANIEEQTVTLEIADKVKVRTTLGSISGKSQVVAQVQK